MIPARRQRTPECLTLLWGGTSSLAVAPALFSSLPYQPLKSFIPIGLAVRSPMIVVGKSGIAATDMAQLIQAAKSSSMTFGSAGNGSIGHLTGEQLIAALGIKLLHVPYKGGAPALTDVLGGQIDLMIDTAQFLELTSRVVYGHLMAVDFKRRVSAEPVDRLVPVRRP